MKMYDNSNRREIVFKSLLRGSRTALLVGAVIFVLVLIMRLILPFVVWLLSGFLTAFGS